MGPDGIIPPILSPLPQGEAAAICLTPGPEWQLLTCRVLPGLIIAAAARPNPAYPDQWSAASPAHSPCSQSHARPARRVATTAGGLLPHRFAPYRRSLGVPAGMLSVAVVVRTRLSPACPHLLFREATLSPPSTSAGWELGVGKFLWAACCYPATAHPPAPSMIIPRD